MLGISDAELFRRAIESRILDVWTSFTGRIESYDAESRTASIAPVIERPVPTDEGMTFEALPVLPNVPIRFPLGGGGTYAITWPLQKGDFVDVHVTTFSQAHWRRTGQISDPGDVRPHNLGSCYAVPGACPNQQALNQAQQLALVIEAPSIKLGKAASDLVALAPLVMQGLNKVKSAMTAAVIVAGDGGASLKSTFLSALGSFADVSASKVKAE